MSWSLRSTFLAATAALALAGAAPASGAETAAPPSHLRAYNLDWLNYIDPQDLPPTRYAVCIVESGLAITPDTPPDDPAGPILRRLATDGGSGEPQGTAEEQLHGTRMAMAAVAPINDWGTIGTWTGGRVISVRAMVEGETTFRAEAYRRGIDACTHLATYIPVAAINLSLACADCSFTAEEADSLADRVVAAHKLGISVVAAAGNAPGHAVQLPAASPGVLAVAAGDMSGRLCPYASADYRVALVGPACPVDSADIYSGQPAAMWGAGSSTATAVTSSVIAALRTLRPDLDRRSIEAAVLGPAGAPLDGEAAAIRIGLGSVVERARLRQQGAERSDASSEQPLARHPLPHAPPQSKRIRKRLARPRFLQVRWRDRRLLVSVARPTARAQLEVVARVHSNAFETRLLARRRRPDRRLRMTLKQEPDEVAARWLPKPGAETTWAPSRWSILVR